MSRILTSLSDELATYHWRTEQFLKLTAQDGKTLSIAQAELLAHCDCDYREAEKLVKKGCPMELALSILI